MVEAVAWCEELTQQPHHRWVAEHLPEGLAVRRRPAEHAPKIRTAGAAVAGQLRRRAPVQAASAQLPGALVQLIEVSVDGGVGARDHVGIKRASQHNVAV